jgi:flagellar biosynthetic protein FliR
MISIKVIFVFALIIARLAGMMVFAPVFNRKEIFSLAKVSFMIWTALVMIYIIPVSLDLPSQALGDFFAALTEFIVGAITGFTMDLMVSGLEFAGTIMDTQAGLSVASLLDPSSGRTITLLSLLLKNVAIMIFLLLDGHHLVLSALVHSFRLLPIGSSYNLGQGAFDLVILSKYIFFIGLQMAAPIILVVFLIDFGFGVLNRVAEQINVFQLGFQLKPSISLFIFLLTAPTIVQSLSSILEQLSTHVLQIFNALHFPV